MLSRKKKILIFQFFLLITGIFLIFLTYINNQKSSDNEIISKKAKSEIEFKLNKNKDNENTFYNIEYSGLDLSGNRYILKAREAANDRSNEKLVNLKFVGPGENCSVSMPKLIISIRFFETPNSKIWSFICWASQVINFALFKKARIKIQYKKFFLLISMSEPHGVETIVRNPESNAIKP